MELLLKYGHNYLILDYYFAYLVAAHQAALNRYEMIDAKVIEDVFEVYLQMTRTNLEVALVWLMRIKRLVREKDFNQAHGSIMAYIKFCQQYGFTKLKLEAELMHCQIYIELGEFSNAMLLITKTIASLGSHDGNFGRLRLVG
jgi:hypothetical protein